MNITDRQEAVLNFIRWFIQEKKYAPSSREIQTYFGYASQTAAINHLKALKRKGRIDYQPKTPRTIVVL